MEHEFNNRISAQRKILQIVNRKPWAAEALFGLSSKAIDRWVSINRIDPTSRIVIMVKNISGKLFFLANKSQDQVSEEYRKVRANIIAATDALQSELGSLSTGG